MQLKPLIWDYTGSVWKGRVDGLLSHASFTIAGSGALDEYLVQPDFKGIESVTCTGLETAKAKAQELLNSYALSLIF